MQRVWAAVLSVWATIAIVGVLAWSHAPAPSASQPVAQTLVVQKNGHLVVVPAAAPAAVHATTHTSPVR